MHRHSAYLDRLIACCALGLALILMGLTQTAQAAPGQSGKVVPFRSHVKEAAAYRDLHDGTVSSSQYMQAYAHTQAMPQARTLPATARTGPSANAPATNLPPVGSWTSLGPSVMDTDVANPFYLFQFGPNSGRVADIAVDPTTSGANTVIYAATAGGGVWKSSNNGTSWIPTTDNMPLLAMGAITIDPNNHNIIYAATGESNNCGGCGYGIGIYKSTNAALTWTLISGNTFISQPGTGTGSSHKFSAIKVDPNNSQSVWIAGRQGIYHSTNGGVNWTHIVPTGVSSTTPASDVVIDTASNPSTVYVGISRFTGLSDAGIYKGVPSGSTFTWADVTPAGLTKTVLGRIVLDLRGGALYAGIADGFDNLLGDNFNDGSGTNTNHGNIYKSINHGLGWTALALGPNTPDPCNPAGFGGQCSYDFYVRIDPGTPTRVYVGGIDIIESTNNGTSWTDITNGYALTTGGPVHTDQHGLAFSGTGTPRTIYIGNDGGVYSSSDGGNLWQNLNTNLTTAEIWAASAGTNFANQRVVWAGMQDNGTNKFTGNSKWEELYGGDGGYTAIDPTDERIVYEEYVFLAISKSTDGGASWTGATNGLPPKQNRDKLIVDGPGAVSGALFIAPFIIDPTPANHLHLIAGSDAVFETIDGANNWCQISQVFSGDPLGSGVSISALAIAPSTSGLGSETIYAGLADGRVFKTTAGYINHGVSCPAPLTWTEVDTNLPTRFVTGLAVDQADPNTVYATYGTGSGSFFVSLGPYAYKTTNGGTSWNSVMGAGATALPTTNENSVVTYQTTTGAAVVVGGDQGAFLSTDGGTTWNALKNGLPNATINLLFMDFARSTLFAGTHSRGVWAIPIPQTDVTAGTGDTVGTFTPGDTNLNPTRFNLRNSLTSGSADITVAFGRPTDIPIMGDWDGDGIDTVGVFRPSLGTFILKNSNDPLTPVAYSFTFGIPGDIPIVGDWTHAGHDSVGVYRPSTGQFFLRNSFTTGYADTTITFGNVGDLPVTGDWNGDGFDTVGVFRPSTTQFILEDAICAVSCSPSASATFTYGSPTDLPVTGDWQNTGKTVIGVWRPSNETFYLRNSLTTGYADTTFTFGTAGDKPLTGHWNKSGPAYVPPPGTQSAPTPVLAPTFIPSKK